MKQVSKMMCCLTVLLAVFLTQSAFADLITLQPGPGDGKDTFAWSRSGSTTEDYSNAERHWIQHNSGSWNSKGYYQFDLSGLDASWIITSAELELHHIIYGSSWPSGLVTTNFALKEIVSTWNQNTTNWNSQPDLGTSFNTTDSFNQSDLILTNPVDNEAFSTTVDLTSMVTAWHTGTLTNNGFAYYMTSSYGFGGQDHYIVASDFPNPADPTDPIYRPKLTINYSTVPEPTTMLLFGIGLIGLAGARRRVKG